MTLFWIASIILIVLSCVVVALPVIRRKENDDEALRDELNKAFYKDRLSELEEENDEGLVVNQQELIAELKQSLLDDVPSEQIEKKQSDISPAFVLIPSMLLVLALSYGMYWQFGAADHVKQWQEVSANLPSLSKKLMAPEGVMLTDDEMEDLTLALRTRLHYQPEDSTGWLLLGRVALANRDVETAIGAMKRAYKTEPESDDVKLGYAQALMLSHDDMDQDTARKLLGQLIQNDYVDIRVFSLLAFDAFERQDYAAAIRYWRAMQQMIGPQDSRFEMLERSIQNAAQQMDGPQGASVSVTISLGEGVQVPENAALIVSVHNADGSPMPIAAARYPVGQLPRTVLLDDGNSMMEGNSLSQLKELLVRARVDLDGNVATRDGDWFGESEAVKLGESVEVIIDKQY
ncbi:c-type cytochrome biogenesis protein CcmI [Vibrio sonorensis]|uniref:c-type cytochrome biogenesis protein CcmI n=1 Tax=Vibrio sonorensis TaxID=1004316 RepID=UPI0008D8F21B|nr:c-type cytochrome biogenesis protein CcmI [Vibrio sonorensis]